MKKAAKMLSGLMVTALWVLWAIPAMAQAVPSPQVPEPGTLVLLGLGVLGLAGLRKKIK